MRIDLPTTFSASVTVDKAPWDDPDFEGSVTIELLWGNHIIRTWPGQDYDTYVPGSESSQENLDEFIADKLRAIFGSDDAA